MLLLVPVLEETAGAGAGGVSDAKEVDHDRVETSMRRQRNRTTAEYAPWEMALKLEEALSMRHEPEEFTRTKKLPTGLLEELGKPEHELAKGHLTGERKGPKSWLCKRVELDAMTAPQEVEYVERKLEEAGVRGKVIPPESELPGLAEEIYRHEHGRLVEEVLRDLLSLDEVKKEFADEVMEEFELENLGKELSVERGREER